MVNFVTGRMLTAADKTNTETHYAYGIWDAAGSNSGMLDSNINRANLYFRHNYHACAHRK